MYRLRVRTNFEEWLVQKEFCFVPTLSRITFLLLVQKDLCADTESIEPKDG